MLLKSELNDDVVSATNAKHVPVSSVKNRSIKTYASVKNFPVVIEIYCLFRKSNRRRHFGREQQLSVANDARPGVMLFCLLISSGPFRVDRVTSSVLLLGKMRLCFAVLG